MGSERILSGGTYIVRINEVGRVINEYGWASLKIINNDVIKILCESILGNEDSCIYTFQIKNKIPNENKYYEHIKLMLKSGFNSIFACNFSEIESFKCSCEKYFRSLDKQLDKKIVKKIVNK